jgi:RNA polymerase sigma-70 factor, ECF subfamily
MTITASHWPDLVQHRGFLFALAYRMLGVAADAQDVVHDALLRYAEATPVSVESQRAYLTTIATRLCLDRLKAATHRRTTYVGPWLPEPLLSAVAPVATPADKLSLASSAACGLLRILDQLSAAERAALLLHEIFDVSYGEIATALQCSEASCRQMVHRAIKHVRAERSASRATAALKQQLTVAFFMAAQSGDVASLQRLLTDDARAVSDGGGKVSAATREVVGAQRVARFICGLAAKGIAVAHIQIAMMWFGDEPAIAIYDQNSVHSVMSLDCSADKIHAVYNVRNPDKLREVSTLLLHARLAPVS